MGMGQLASKIKGHYVTRTLQRFNLESRTEKLLKQDKPTAAPKYPSDIKIREDVLRDMSEQSKEGLHGKSTGLHGRLKQVYVTSMDPPSDTGFDADINRRRPLNPDRPMPGKGTRGRDRSGFDIDEIEFRLPKGKTTLEKAQEMLATHRVDQEKNTPTVLAQFYNLDLAQTEAVLEHYRVFGHVKAKVITAKEIQDSQDPYRAQPDWVEAAGEHPPILTEDQVPRAGALPKASPPAPILLHREIDKVAIELGKSDVVTNKSIDSGSKKIGEQKTLKDSDVDNEKR